MNKYKTTLVVSGLFLVFIVAVRQGLFGNFVSNNMGAFFVVHMLVIGIGFFVIYRIRSFPFRASINAVGGWRRNVSRLSLALAPLILTGVWAAKNVAIQPITLTDGTQVRSASWREDRGHYYARFNGSNEIEISKSRYDELQNGLNDTFQNLWLFMSLALFGMAWAIYFWPGIDKVTQNAIQETPENTLTKLRRIVFSNPFRTIWRTEPFNVAIQGAPAEKLTELKESVPRVAIFTLFSQACVGYVGARSVRIYRYRPLNNSWGNAVFSARIVSNPNGFSLTGIFRNAWYSRIFLSVWFAGVTAAIPSFLLIGLMQSTPGDKYLGWIFPVVPIFMFVFGQFFLSFGNDRWSSDKEYIRNFLSERLGSAQRT